MASDITAELVDLSDLGTALATLDNTRDRSWQDNLSEAGSGSITFQNDDDDLALIVTPNTLVNFSVLGVLAFTLLLEAFEATLVSLQEEAEEVTVWSGRGHLALFDRGVVYPALGVGRIPIQEDRAFNWTSPDFDDASWIPANAVTTMTTAQASWPIPFDAEFPTDGSDPDILWANDGSMTDASDGTCYFRQVFTTTFNGRHQLFLLIDNGGEVYIDGTFVGSATGAFIHTAIYDIDLSAGTHILAVVGINGPQPSPDIDNPAGVGWSIWIPGYPPTPIAQSDASTAIMVEYATEPPGMTPGKVLLIALAEAQARGALEYITVSFTEDEDSDGNPWPVVADIATKVGTTLLTFLRELSGTYIDFYMAPGTFVLDVWNFGGRGTGTAVNFHVPTDPADATTGNLLEHHEKGEA